MRIILYILVLIGSINLQAQNGDPILYFGNSQVGMQWDGSDYIALNNKHTPYGETSSAVAVDDQSNTLLFYTDGDIVVDQDHTTILATGLLANQNANQSVAICKVPGQCNQYYILTNSTTQTNGNIYSTIVESNNGIISIPAATKNQLVASNNGQGILILNKIGTDEYWLITSDVQNDVIQVYDISASGIALHQESTLDFGATTVDLYENVSLKYNDALEIIGGVTSSNSSGSNIAFSIRFNRTTGSFSLPRPLGFAAGFFNAWDCEWSNSGDNFYFSSLTNTAVYQFSLTSGVVSKIATESGFDGGGLKMGLDGKIYHISNRNSNMLATINLPEANGVACDYQTNTFMFLENINAFSFSSVGIINSSSIMISNDTTVCRGDAVHLSASGGNSYSWSPSTDLSCTSCPNPISTPNSNITYIVEATQMNGCIIKDSVSINVNNSPVSNLNDTSICQGNSIVLDAGNNGASYLWNNGTTTQTNTISNSGLVTVEITNNEGCSIIDSSVVSEANSTNLQILGNLSSCEHTTLSLSNSVGSILWSTGDTTPTIIYSEVGTNLIGVDVTNSCGTFSASETVSIGKFLEPDFLGPDTTLCNPPYTIDIDVPGANIFWSDGDNGMPKDITTTNLYFLNINYFGCISTDTVYVEIIDTASFDLGEDIYSCLNDPIILATGLLFADHVWSNSETTEAIEVTSEGNYSVSVNFDQCIATDSISVYYGNGFENGHIIPDAFSPNDDGINDCLRVHGDPDYDFRIEIYNREGTMVYKSTDITDCWKGEFNGTELPQGLYFYILNTVDCFGNPLIKKGELIIAK